MELNLQTTTNSILILVVGFISVYLQFRYFLKRFEATVKDLFLINLCSMGIFIILTLTISGIFSYVESLFPGQLGVMSDIFFFVVPIGLSFAVATSMFEKAGMETKDAAKITLAWYGITTVLFLIFRGLLSLLFNTGV